MHAYTYGRAFPRRTESIDCKLHMNMKCSVACDVRDAYELQFSIIHVTRRIVVYLPRCVAPLPTHANHALIR